jgi:chromosome segregation ATPase
MLLRPSKLWMAVAAAVAATSVGTGTVWSYLRTAHSQLGQSLRDAVPIAFELKRLDQMTSDLIPEIRANQKVAAQLDVEIEYLGREIEALQNSQKDAKSQMQKLRQALTHDRKSYEFGGRPFTRQEIEQDLERRLQQYDNTAVQLAAKEQLQAARQRTLDAAAERIRQYQQQHDLLVQKAASLQGELKLVELAQDTGNVDLDHSKLNEAKQLAQEVEKRIRTMQKLVEGQRQNPGEVPVEADGRPVTDRFDEYFAGQPTTK